MERFQRTALIIGEEGLDILRRSKVAVFGVGGVGGAACEALARSGIGTLILVDHDVVDITNINRQIVALESTIGRPKVGVMADRIREINPNCQVIAYQQFYAAERSADLLRPDLDFVVDAIDSVTSKIDLIVGCRKRGIPIVSSMGAGNKLDPTQLQVADISQTHTCPLAKAVRLGLKKHDITSGVQVVFSTERPTRLMPGRTPGSTAFVPPAVGMVLASVVVRKLLDRSEGHGTV
ncbi:MAG: tRNA threonylcarbamoyladenosine dehydratase [Firmicutes bacterium]|nr:tRNA threonylcarbamoyladenosine dehydratase [Bacillota bacterium]